MATPDYELEVALSFAGEDRIYVHDIAEELLNRGVKVFFADFAQSELWGQSLPEYLDEVFRKKSRFVIPFISRYYVTKPWPRYEAASALARAVGGSSPYILPVRLDDSELPGLLPTVVYIDGRRTTKEELADLLMDKLGRECRPDAHPQPIGLVPRTSDELQDLLGKRPRFWEYLLFGAVLLQRKDTLEPKFRDNELGLVRPIGPFLPDHEAHTFLLTSMGDLQAYAGNATRLLAPAAVEAAMGPPGVPGDPARIEHLAKGLVGFYEDLLDASARIRGGRTNSHLRRLCELTANLATTPIREFREFVDDYVVRLESVIAETLAEAQPPDKPREVNFTLVLSIPDEDLRELTAEIERLKQQLNGRE